ncbi:Permease, cytosine/purine, uracil, thiamine, allantoin family [Escherichia coli]|nr:Permease, cytosine/purine, uracil, thiamine, allantoin family [Escherichia coli]
MAILAQNKKVFMVIIIFDAIFMMDGNDSNLLIVFYVQIMPDDFVMQLHRF